MSSILFFVSAMEGGGAGHGRFAELSAICRCNGSRNWPGNASCCRGADLPADELC